MAQTYYSQILNWDWKYIVNNAEPGLDYDGNKIKSTYLGSVFNIMPSGKYYMPWSSNVTEAEAQKDSRFLEALEKVASKFGGWIESGEGNPTDMYFVTNNV
jgi:hypothetical protein